jgi:hypothetical protein
VEALPQQGGDEPHHDAAEHLGGVLHAVVDDLDDALVLGFLDDDRVLDGRAEEHHLGHPVEDQVADDGGERGGAVGLAGEADGHAHGEEQG